MENIFFKNYFIVVQAQLSAFTAHYSPLPRKFHMILGREVVLAI